MNVFAGGLPASSDHGSANNSRIDIPYAKQGNEKSKYIACLFSIELLNACNAPFDQEIKPVKGDSVVVHIPRHQRMNILITEQVVDKLRLNQLRQGFDGIEIRVWYGYALSSQSKMIALKNSLGKWEQ